MRFKSLCLSLIATLLFAATCWIADDYRQLLSLCPEVDGLVLTFIESGARIENQFSKMSVPERLAKVVNTASAVVCGEFGKMLWLRTFAYNKKEYANLRACLDLINWRSGMGVMVKDTPHDFFLTHPDNPLIGALRHPTLVEFDVCGEYHGQSVILNTIPEYYAERWRRLSARPDVVGYVARRRLAREQRRYAAYGKLYPVGTWDWKKDAE